MKSLGMRRTKRLVCKGDSKGFPIGCEGQCMSDLVCDYSAAGSCAAALKAIRLCSETSTEAKAAVKAEADG